MSRTPRKDSLSSSFKVVTGTSLQISPNLEALLQHDELTRRTCGSPTNLYHPISGFAVSLPPPPPRNVMKKPPSVESRANLKEIRRKRSVNIKSDSWPDALPVCNTPGTGPSSPEYSRSASATPNPYINPTPTINTTDSREEPGQLKLTRLSTKTTVPLARRSEPDVPRTPPLIIPSSHSLSSHRSSPTLYKVERMFTKGRESLSILTSAAIPSGLKIKQDDHIDRRPHRAELAELGANQSSFSTQPQLRQARALGNQSSMSHQLFAFGDTETALVSNVASMITGTQQLSPARLKLDSAASSPSISPARSLSGVPAGKPSEPPTTHYASSLPHLPPISPIEMPSLQRRSNDDQQSFIDFFSPFSPLSQDTQDVISTLSARRPSAPAILSSSINSTTSYNNSPLDDLPSMVFAPPSPTSAPNERPSSPAYSRPSSSLSSYSDVSAMIFAPGSPTSGPPLSPISPCPGSSLSSVIAPHSPASPPTTAALKPQIPTINKPLLERRGRRARLQKRSVSSSPQPPITRLRVPLPPTTNKLQPSERADLVRRNRKLVQLLGQTPGTGVATSEVEEPRLFKMLPQPAFSALLGSVKQRHNHRHAMSVSVALKTPGLKTEPSSPWQVLDNSSSSNGRRHSTPFTPRGFTFYLDDSVDPRDTCDHHGPHRHWNITGSPTSFIDLSDEETPRDTSDVISIETVNERRNHSSSPSSLVESLAPEERAEAEKRRKRDKLAKLHRFLGSRVPTDLVVGHIAGPSLPPASMPEGRDMWLYRRMSEASSLSFERVKDELDVEEKALNVRRAQKMEKLFGMPPPQTLYHTRHAPTKVARSQPTSPVSSIMVPHYLSDDGIGIPRRNPNQTAYMKGKRTHRPGTSESTTFLLPSNSADSPESPTSRFLDGPSVYMNYQHSIASLTDIIERDDRESLAELHRFLHGDPVESPTEDQPLLAPHRLSGSSYSHKSERRHSLPTRTSISTEIIPPCKPEASDFQLRRRRAAKLTNFFGVDYRELIHDILESIEKGVEEERKRGTLRPEEVESLLHKLHDLRTRRDGFL